MARVYLDEPWVWTVTFGAFMMNCLTLGLLKSYTILMVEYQNYLHFSTSMGMLAGGILVSSVGFLSPVTSLLCERFTTRRVMLFSSLITCACFVGISFVRSTEAYVVLFFLLGCSLSLAYSPALCMVSRCHKRRQTLATGITMCGSSAGLMLVPALLTALLQFFPVQFCVFILGAIYLNLAVTAVLMPDKIIDRDTKKILFVEPINQSSLSEGFKLSCFNDWSIRQLVRFGVFVLATILSNAGFVSQYTQYAGYAKESGLYGRDIALILGLQGALDGTCRIAIGYISDRHLCPNWVYLSCALILMGLNACVTTLWTGFVPCVFYSVVYAVTGGVYVTTLFAVTRDIVGLKYLGRAYAVLLMFHGGTSVPVQYLIGFVRDHSSSYAWSIRTSGLLVTTAGLIMALDRVRDLPAFRGKCKTSEMSGISTDDMT